MLSVVMDAELSASRGIPLHGQPTRAVLLSTLPRGKWPYHCLFAGQFERLAVYKLPSHINIIVMSNMSKQSSFCGSMFLHLSLVYGNFLLPSQMKGRLLAGLKLVAGIEDSCN